MKRFFIVILLVTVLLLNVTWVCAQEPTELKAKTDKQGYYVGDTVIVDLTVSNADGLYGIDLHMSYDPSYLTLESDGIVADVWSDGFVDYVQGASDLKLVATKKGDVPGISGNTVLFSFKFTAKTFGESLVEISNIRAADKEGNFIDINDNTSVEVYIKRQEYEIYPEIAAFVTRFYEICLGKKPDTEVLNHWVGGLASGQITGADFAMNIVLGNEFIDRNLPDDEFVVTMYNAFFNRFPDDEGASFWIRGLDMGYSRRYVLAGFVRSDEYLNMCNAYGILPGNIDTTGEDEPDLSNKYHLTKLFVNRLYVLCLGKQPDTQGYNYWGDALYKGKTTAANAAESFILGQEFTDRELSDTEFVDIIYRAIMNRPPDETGKNFWEGMLAKGYSRRYVLAGFIGSDEFANICNEYGIIQGSISVTIDDMPGQ